MNYIRLFRRVITALIIFIAILFIFRLHGLKLDELFIDSLSIHSPYINVLVSLTILFLTIWIGECTIDHLINKYYEKKEKENEEKAIQKFKEECKEDMIISNVILEKGIYQIYAIIEKFEIFGNRPILDGQEFRTITYSVKEKSSVKDFLNEMHNNKFNKFIITEIRGIKKEELLHGQMSLHKYL